MQCDPTAATSEFWGVSWDKKNRRWKAQYTDADGKLRHIDYYNTQEQPRTPSTRRSARFLQTSKLGARRTQSSTGDLCPARVWHAAMGQTPAAAESAAARSPPPRRRRRARAGRAERSTSTSSSPTTKTVGTRRTHA